MSNPVYEFEDESLDRFSLLNLILKAESYSNNISWKNDFKDQVVL